MKRTEVILDPMTIKTAQTLPAVEKFVKVLTGNSLEKWDGASILSGTSPLRMIRVSVEYGNKSPQLKVEFTGSQFSHEGGEKLSKGASYYGSTRSLRSLDEEEIGLLLDVCKTTSYPVEKIGGALVKEALETGQFNEVK